MRPLLGALLAPKVHRDGALQRLMADDVMVRHRFHIAQHIRAPKPAVPYRRRPMRHAGALPAPHVQQLLLVQLLLGATALQRGVRQRGDALLAVHQAHDLERMQMVLVLERRAAQVQDQLQHAGLLQCPQHLIVEAGIVVGAPLGVRAGRHGEHVANEDENALDQEALLLGAFRPVLAGGEGFSRITS